ncbi:hypothetical protein Dimus_000783 [Dionaea muscipula]
MVGKGNGGAGSWFCSCRVVVKGNCGVWTKGKDGGIDKVNLCILAKELQMKQAEEGPVMVRWDKVSAKDDGETSFCKRWYKTFLTSPILVVLQLKSGETGLLPKKIDQVVVLLL